LVVLDLWLASDTMMRGTPAMQLLSYHLGLGKPVVALQRLGGRSLARSTGGSPGWQAHALSASGR
jgi:hypothetical protein